MRVKYLALLWTLAILSASASAQFISPTIAGVAPNDSNVPVIQPGEWISIYGNGLACGDYTWAGNFPTNLGGVTVTVNGKPAYIWFADPVQINAQAPDDTARGSVVVTVDYICPGVEYAANSTVTLADYAPAFSLLDGKHVAGQIYTPTGYVVVGPTGAFSFPTRPVQAGEILTLYGVGFGPTTPEVPAGHSFSGSAPTNSPVTITIGGVPADVQYSGITEAGAYQFNLVVPQGTGSGDVPIQGIVNGVSTPAIAFVTVE